MEGQVQARFPRRGNRRDHAQPQQFGIDESLGLRRHCRHAGRRQQQNRVPAHSQKGQEERQSEIFDRVSYSAADESVGA